MLLRRSGDDLIVFMHGIGCAKESFAGAFEAPALADYSLCAFDFPGHGEAARSSRYSVEAYADASVRLVEEIGAKRVVLVAHSMGGAVGLIAAQQLDVAFFVNVEGNLVAEDCDLVSRKTARTSFDTFTTRGFYKFVARLRESPRAEVQAWAEWYAECDPVAMHQISASLVEWSDSGRLLDFFLAMPNKAYVYGGDASRVEYVLPKLPDVPTYSVPDAGHFPMVENPQGFYSLLAEVIRR